MLSRLTKKTPVKSYLFEKWKYPAIVGPSKITQFQVGPRNGFLPREAPMYDLPVKYSVLDQILKEMPTERKNSTLANGKFGETIMKDLPELSVKEAENDSRLQMALFRDYTFAASAYLLEPCELEFRRTGTYGLGRSILPRNIAVPLATLAKQINTHPYMEYAQSYALYNYKKNDEKKGLDYDNLSLIREFTGLQSERGFILTHVAMVKNSPALVVGVLNVLESIESGNRDRFNSSMADLTETMTSINAVMETMWGNSLPKDYSRFRTYIFGTKAQPMFPNGVIYKGVSTVPVFYRGESGANDSMVPTIDNLLQLTKNMPKNPLTDMLRDFRSYRPEGHREWLSWLESAAESFNVREYAKRDYTSIAAYMRLLDQVRDFRNRHWNFTKEYIIKHSKHPVATGGSPITTWLPNQLSVVLDSIVEMGNAAIKAKHKVTTKMLDDDLYDIQRMLDLASVQKISLDRDTAKLRKQYAQ